MVEFLDIVKFKIGSRSSIMFREANVAGSCLRSQAGGYEAYYFVRMPLTGNLREMLAVWEWLYNNNVVGNLSLGI